MSETRPNSSDPQFDLIDVRPDDLFNAQQRQRNGNGSDGKKARPAIKSYEPPNLGKAIRLPVPDFSNPNRKLTCLEVDFPIAPINSLAKVEVSSGPARKRIYCMSKWWARRASSVFRSMLIAASTESPDNPEEAAKRVWDHYYCNHQKAGSFKKLKVLDPFMGGGTTLVEGARLGFQATGVDLNPVAWFVTKNELACSDPAQVKAFFDRIEAEVKPLIQPFYTTTCSRGHKGRWIDTSKTKPDGSVPAASVMPEGFDPIDLRPDQRKSYRWEGPELVYTFWAKHGPCAGSQGQPCGHRTPIFRSPIIAEKKLSAEFITIYCNCGQEFNAELGETRMAPGAERIVVDSEPPFTELSQPFALRLKNYPKGDPDDKRRRVDELLAMVDAEPGLRCPHCGALADKIARSERGDTIRAILQRHAKPNTRTADIKKRDFLIDSRHVFMYLLIHPKWMEGTPGQDGEGHEYGGYAGADPAATATWWLARLEGLSFVEVRGRVKLSEDTGFVAAEETEDVGAQAGDEVEASDAALDRKLYGPPPRITLRDGTVIDARKSTVPGKSEFRCDTDGIEQDILTSVGCTEHTAPVAPYAYQCYCPQCDAEGFTYGGRYFKAPDTADINRVARAEHEWAARRAKDLVDYWPKSPCWDAYMMRANGGVNQGWGYTHWWKMFNSRQLLVHSQLLRCIAEASADKWSLDVREQALGAWQEFSRHQSMFCFWDIQQDCLAPMLANANYHPKALIVENNQWLAIGRANWASCLSGVLAGMNWCQRPTELYMNPSETGSRTIKVETGDPLAFGLASLDCRSTTDLPAIPDGEFDLAVTDPPFGNNLFYGDLSDYFYVWMRLALLKWYTDMPEAGYFKPERTPRSVEAVQNKVEHPDDREVWEQEPLVTEKSLAMVRQHANDPSLQINDSNPLYRREPASEFYCNTLTACWRETARVLKPGGLMAFTFHHSADAPWVDVLEALFDAGFVLVATYPIRSDETKGAGGAFGSRKIEYDIIHVCRKRLVEPQSVAWAAMRRWVKSEAARYKQLLEHVHGKDLTPADLLVILRGKALEFYSRHYGRVLTGDSQVLSVRDALLGINLLLEDITADPGSSALRPPDNIEPASRLMLGLFRDRTEMSRDELSKTLRGTGVEPNDLQARGWVRIVGTKVHAKPIAERFVEFRVPGRTRKAMLKTDLDQAHFLIGVATGGSGLSVPAELDGWGVALKRSTDAVLGWYAQTTGDKETREAAERALRLVEAWRNRPAPEAPQMTLWQQVEAAAEVG